MSVPLQFLILLCICFSSTKALVEVLSPPEIAGVYPDAPLNMNPRKFNITGELFFPGLGICHKDLPDMNATGKVMLVMGDPLCESADFARAVLKNNPGVLGQIILCFSRTCSVLGHLEAREFDNDQSIQFPSLECNDYLKIYAYMHKPNHKPVIIHIHDTDYNPWLSLGDGPAGHFTQVFFELFAFVCLFIALAKLFVFVKFQGFRANVSQICLELELLAAIMRILYFIQPLDFGSVYMPWAAGTWFVDAPNILSLLSTLLITFYWHEIMSVMKERLTNKLITNLSKFRIPFLLVAIVVVVLYIVATVNSILYFTSANANTVSAIVALIVNFLVSVFFFVIGYKILRVSSANSKSLGERKTNRVSKFIIAAAVFMDLRTLGLILYLSPLTANGRGPYFLIWWIVWLGSFGISFSKIMAFEPPPDAGASFRSYFRRPNIFVRMMLERYLGWSMTESLSSNVALSNTESSSKLKASGPSEDLESAKKSVEEDSFSNDI